MEGPKAAIDRLLEHRFANPLGQDGSGIGKHAVPQVRQRIEHGGDEHVASNPANSIKVNRDQAAARRSTGIT